MYRGLLRKGRVEREGTDSKLCNPWNPIMQCDSVEREVSALNTKGSLEVQTQIHIRKWNSEY